MQERELVGAGDGLAEHRDVGEERVVVDLLEEVAADLLAGHLAADREHGRVGLLRVVQAVEQVDRTRARPCPCRPRAAPVSCAWALAANAPASSWRTPTHSIRSSRRIASVTGLRASPTTPQTWVTPWSARASISSSATVVMGLLGAGQRRSGREAVGIGSYPVALPRCRAGRAAAGRPRGARTSRRSDRMRAVVDPPPQHVRPELVEGVQAHRRDRPAWPARPWPAGSARPARSCRGRRGPAARLGSWVATPTGQVLVWQVWAWMQPTAIIIARAALV